jgi:hypothetical protein
LGDEETKGLEIGLSVGPPLPAKAFVVDECYRHGRACVPFEVAHEADTVKKVVALPSRIKTETKSL